MFMHHHLSKFYFILHLLYHSFFSMSAAAKEMIKFPPGPHDALNKLHIF